MFRQRAGRVNWKRLTSLDYDGLLHDRDGETVGELNACIDNLTFSLFTARDVESNSCEAVVLFARVMQLIVEYLLCSQEKQAKSLVETVTRNKQMKRRNHVLVRELESLREETKVYRKQLAMLKSHGFDPSAAAKRFQYVMGAPSEKSDSPLLVSLLHHEEATRTFVRGLLEEQRAAFSKETASLAQRSDRDASESGELRQLRERVAQLEAREPHPRERQSEAVAEQERVSRLLLERERQLEASQREASDARQRAEIGLMAKSEALSSLETDLRRREEALRVREQEAVARSSAGGFPERLLLSQLQLRSKLAAARAVFGLLKRGSVLGCLLHLLILTSRRAFV